MSTTILKRQFITDASDNPIGVILPLDEFALVRNILERYRPLLGPAQAADPLAQMEQAANDPLFLADLHETMAAFAVADAEGWEAHA